MRGRGVRCRPFSWVVAVSCGDLGLEQVLPRCPCGDSMLLPAAADCRLPVCTPAVLLGGLASGQSGHPPAG
jgi:hypothetical protein